jgi:hypothetical protein
VDTLLVVSVVECIVQCYVICHIWRISVCAHSTPWYVSKLDNFRISIYYFALVKRLNLNSHVL